MMNRNKRKVKKVKQKIKNPPSRSSFCCICHRKVVQFDIDLFGDKAYLAASRICPECLYLHTGESLI